MRERLKGTHGARILADSTRPAKLESALGSATRAAMNAWLAGALASALACAPAADSVKSLAPGAGESDEGRGAERGRPPDDAWLTRLGVGSAQTQRVCARGSRDHVATALCGADVTLGGLSDLHAALGLGDPAHRFVAATTHSLGLGVRYVSPANPRAFVFRADGVPVPFERFSVVGFARGEQLIELVGMDPTSLEYHFYLLRFEQACDLTGCTPAELLTARIESDWTGWTLYAEEDLEDTPFDCITCHRPFGPGTPKQLLMRQTASPWLHWGDFHGASETRLCPEPKWPAPGPFIPGEGLAVISALEGANGSYAGVPVDELAQAPSGERFALFLSDAENTLRSTRKPADYPYAQLNFGSTEALCERLATGTSPTWERQRSESLALGLPVPFYAEDVLEPGQRAAILADRAGLLRERSHDEPLAVASGWLAANVGSSVGFAPRDTDSAPELLRAFCVRCHAASTEPHLARSRFDAEHAEVFDPAVARAIRTRITLPSTAPERMPPWRSGELPAWAVARIETYLDEHCSEPGACR